MSNYLYTQFSREKRVQPIHDSLTQSSAYCPLMATIFLVYVKGLTEGGASGVGVAIRDRDGGLLFEVSKVCRHEDWQASPELVDFKALIEGLDAAAGLDLKRVSIVTDNPLLYQFIMGEKSLAMENVDSLYDRINSLTRKFSHIHISLVSSEHMTFVVELARNAVVSKVNHVAGTSNADNPTETCSICFESTSTDQMFEITGCLHRYCFSCMSRHTQSKLSQGSLPKCPFENCKTRLILSSCKKFLTPELFGILSQRVKEASIPTVEKIYCPYPKCSALLSRTQLQDSTGSLGRKCPECSGIFCINCKVPWHRNMNCADFKKQNPYQSKADKKLKALATQNLWRQCPKCCHMISLAKGCYHIYCRCGHQFCYTCGAAWKQKKATCKCPVWDHRNIEKAEQTRPPIYRRLLKNGHDTCTIL